MGFKFCQTPQWWLQQISNLITVIVATKKAKMTTFVKLDKTTQTQYFLFGVLNEEETLDMDDIECLRRHVFITVCYYSESFIECKQDFETHESYKEFTLIGAVKVSKHGTIYSIDTDTLTRE